MLLKSFVVGLMLLPIVAAAHPNRRNQQCECRDSFRRALHDRDGFAIAPGWNAIQEQIDAGTPAGKFLEKHPKFTDNFKASEVILTPGFVSPRKIIFKDIRYYGYSSTYGQRYYPLNADDSMFNSEIYAVCSFLGLEPVEGSSLGVPESRQDGTVKSGNKVGLVWQFNGYFTGTVGFHGVHESVLGRPSEWDEFEEDEYMADVQCAMPEDQE